MGILNTLRRVAMPDEQQFNIDELLKKQHQLPQENSSTGFLSPPAPLRSIVEPLPEVPQRDLSNVPTDRVELQLPQPSTKDLGAPPVMITHNNKGRPVAAIGGDDPIANNMQLIREQEGYKAPRSTKDQILAFVQGGLPGGIDYATNQNTRNRWATGEDIQSEEGQIARDLGVQSKQASITATKQRPIFQASVQDEREINNALSQYNKLEEYDPDNPAYSGLKDYFESRGLKVPKKLKGSNVVANWSNGQLVLTDKTSGATIGATRDGAQVADAGRTPNTAGLTPNQQASVDTRVSEGQKNREARKANVDAIIKAVAGRQDKQIAATIAQMGDPQEMYGAASDLWGQAQEKESQANSMGIKTEADVATKKQLLEDAQKLKETTVKIQQEARKAASGQRAINKPSSDGKHHYSMTQIQATIDPKTGLTKNGKRLEEVLSALKSRANVVIDQ